MGRNVNKGGDAAADASITAATGCPCGEEVADAKHPLQLSPTQCCGRAAYSGGTAALVMEGLVALVP